MFAILLTKLATDAATNTNTGTYISDGTDVTLKGSASVEQLTKIDNANGDGALKYGSVTDEHR